MAEVRIVTVNCVGFMGKGMALECALRFPEVESEYKALCKRNEVRVGEITWATTADGKILGLFPTKNDYKNLSKMSYISDGLVSLIRDLDLKGITSIALPKLGTELGGLDWRLVEQRILQSFEHSNIDLEIWSFDPKNPDEYATFILDRVSEDMMNASSHAGVSDVILHRLISARASNTFSGVADFLRIQGVGKMTIKKLVAWSHQKPETQVSLFD